MNRPLRLHELLAAYLDNPLVINWKSSAEDQKQCVVVRRFEYGGTEYRPNLSPIKREILSFDQGVAKMFLKQGFIEVKSCMFDLGEATLTERHKKEKVPLFGRGWLTRARFTRGMILLLRPSSKNIFKLSRASMLTCFRVTGL